MEVSVFLNDLQIRGFSILVLGGESCYMFLVRAYSYNPFQFP